MRGIGVEEAAAIGAHHLDGFLRSGGSLRDGLRGAFEAGYFIVRMQILDGTLRHQQQRAYDRKRNQQIERGARDIHPEVAERVRRLARESAHQGDGDGDAGGGGCKVVGRQSHHLGEVTHGGFGCINLPVGVRAETYSSIKGQVGSNQLTGEALRIERQQALETLDEVSEHDAHQAKCQQGTCVVSPVLFVRLIHAAELVDQAFDGPHDGMQERPFAFEQARHERAQRLSQGQQDQEEETNLKHTDEGHWAGLLEALGPQEGIDQIGAYSHGYDGREYIFHKSPAYRRSHPRTYAQAIRKKRIVRTTKNRSSIFTSL